MAMSRKRLLAAATIRILSLSYLGGVTIVDLASADPGPYIGYATLSVLSPEQNKTYNVNSITLTFNVSWASFPDDYALAQYYLDGQGKGSIYAKDAYSPYSVTLNGLNDGAHTVQIKMTVYWKEYESNLVSFNVNTKTSPLASATPAPTPTSAPQLSPSPSPSPSSSLTQKPETSLSPSPTPLQQTSFLGTSLSMEYGYAIVATLLVMSVLALTYYSRKQRSGNHV